MLFVGDDWAEDHHDVEIVAGDGRRLARRRLPEGLAGMSQLHALIAGYLPAEWADLPPGEAARRVKIGIGTERGPWVQAIYPLPLTCQRIDGAHRADEWRIGRRPFIHGAKPTQVLLSLHVFGFAEIVLSISVVRHLVEEPG